jgi:seryl-tRNA synthetase
MLIELALVILLVFQDLTVSQIKAIGQLIDENMKSNAQAMVDTEEARNAALREIGNMLHESVIVSNDEVIRMLLS